MFITIVYLIGAWKEKWAFDPYWLTACVILDVFWVSRVATILSGADPAPIVEFSAGMNETG